MFSNCDVDVWKLRRGSLVAYEDCLTYITDISSIIKIDNTHIVRIYVENMGYAQVGCSDEMDWLEPH